MGVTGHKTYRLCSVAPHQLSFTIVESPEVGVEEEHLTKVEDSSKQDL